MPMPPADPHVERLIEEAMTVRQEGVAVVVTGPGSIAVALTAEAAEASARRLLDAAADARASGEPPPILPIDQR